MQHLELQFLRREVKMIVFKLTLYIVACFISGVRNSDSESLEINLLDSQEISPLYSILMLSDIADIMTEFENNIDSPYDDDIKGRDSESNENVQDLASEYQSYLNKKIRREKDTDVMARKIRNTLSLMKPSLKNHPREFKYNNYLDRSANGHFMPKSKGVDLIFPFESSFKQTLSNPFGTKPGVGIVKKDISRIIKVSGQQSPLIIPKLRHFGPPIPSSCICNKDEIPCNCGCKECLIPFTPETIADSKKYTRDQSPSFFLDPMLNKKMLTKPPKSLYFDIPDTNNQFVPTTLEQPYEKTLNILLKLEIQLPNTDNSNNQKLKVNSEIKSLDYTGNTDNVLPLATIPFPYNLNIPVSLDSLGFQKSIKPNKHYSETIHKVKNHQKKKSRKNNKSKTNQSGISTYHKMHEKIQPTVASTQNNSKDPQKVAVTEMEVISEAMLSDNTIANEILRDPTTITPLSMITEKATEAILPTSVNNTMATSNHSIYTQNDLVENATHVSTDNDNIQQTNKADDVPKEVIPTNRRKRSITVEKKKNITKLPEKHKADHGFLLDEQLLYWPSITVNTSTKSNITTLIVERETQKSKFNFSKDTIRYNHTKALEHAVFGEVDWNDMDAVTPAFMSFVGKYLTGVLTFCSEVICHSMKCEHKLCMHRICAPFHRQNQADHCMGSNNTDSFASMESIMDLPSNTVFEIADILEDKLRGKLFGKATLCTSTKCVTMSAAKKSFYKTKCAVKELASTGHCSSTKKLYA